MVKNFEIITACYYITFSLIDGNFIALIFEHKNIEYYNHGSKPGFWVYFKNNR